MKKAKLWGSLLLSKIILVVLRTHTTRTNTSEKLNHPLSLHSLTMQPIIGRPVETLPSVGGVPVFLPLVCDYIKARANTVGLFRTSGNREAVKQLSEDLSTSTPFITDDVTVHDVCALLKLWMVKLPVPVIDPAITNKVYDEHNPGACMHVLLALPENSRKVVTILMDLVREILRYKDTNRMDLGNLAVCFWFAMSQNAVSVPFKGILWAVWSYINSVTPKATPTVKRRDNISRARANRRDVRFHAIPCH